MRSAAIALTMAACLQILLGFALSATESFDDIDPAVLIIVTIAHVALEALTLSAAVAMAIQVRRFTASPVQRQSTQQLWVLTH